jgi:hypothetical protein
MRNEFASRSFLAVALTGIAFLFFGLVEFVFG